ncbi:SMC family ATPase [Planococcus sp. APC 4015]|nr:SMC family ATPase [Planococcus sp. APC 4015]
MKIHRLEIEGFGPFRDRQVVDFDAVAQDGVFLIAGKTGAGKSSILDAICFALYGDVPRYDDGDRRLRSDHAALDEPTRVELEFTNGDRRWRLERVPSYERLKKSGTGTTLSAAQARLSEWRGDEWVDVAARSVDVANELADILRLTKAQFLQVILLAQGRFHEFLHAKNDDRQRLLRTLFGSHRFSDYEAELEARRKEVSESLELERRGLRQQLESAEQLIADAGGEIDPTADEDVRRDAVGSASLRVAHESEIAAADESARRSENDAAAAAHSLLLRRHDLQQRRDRARVGLAVLEARVADIAADRSLLDAAVTAEALRGLIDAEQRIVHGVADAEAEVRRTSEVWAALVPGTTDPSVLDARIDELSAELGTLADARRVEEGIPALIAAVDSAAITAQRVAEGLDDAKQSRALIPDRIRAHTERAAAAAAIAGGLAAATARTAERRSRRDAALDAERRASDLATAEAAARAAGRSLIAASTALEELRDRRFRDHAGELAELLVDGEPCTVCGATAHPAPAPRRDDPVTADDIERAQAEKDTALATDAAATASLRAVERDLAEATARAGGLDAPAAQAELDAAIAEERTASDAAVERDAEEARRAEAAGALERLEAEIATLEVERLEAEREQARVVDAAAVAHAAVVRARGTHDSVSSRVGAVQAALDAARALVRANRTLSERREAAVAASADLDARLAESTFSDRDGVVAALLDAASRAALDARIREFDADLAGHRGALMDLELEALPEEPIDPTVAATHLAETTQRWREAVDRHVRVQGHAAQLAAASAAADAAHELIAERSTEAAVITELANAIAGRAPNTKKMDLETFVLAAELEKIVVAANARLTEMTDGRFQLQHTDALAAHGRASGLGLTVMDRYTGQARPVQSLSGGETFLASLALALGLAHVVTADAGGVRLDTLFIDEGFGSLDRETLDIAMRTLDDLRVGGRAVGVISHVEAMQADLPAGIIVESTPEGPSIIRQDSAAPLSR